MLGCTSRPAPPTYRTRNWPAYNEALKRPGSLAIWFDRERSREAVPTGRRGRRQTYSDTRNCTDVIADLQVRNAVLNGYTALGISVTGAVG